MEPVAADIAANIELGGVVLLLADAVQLVLLDPRHRAVAVVGGAPGQTIPTPSGAAALFACRTYLLTNHLNMFESKKIWTFYLDCQSFNFLYTNLIPIVSQSFSLLSKLELSFLLQRVHLKQQIQWGTVFDC